MTNEQFDALVDLITALIDDHELYQRNARRDLDIRRTTNILSTARELLVTDSPTEDQPQ
jgi:hypothetical protein